MNHRRTTCRVRPSGPSASPPVERALSTIDRKTLIPGIILVGSVAVLVTCADAPVLTSVTIAPSSVIIEERNGQQRLNANIRDQYGNPMSGVRVAWSSRDPQVAVVGDDGTVRAVSNGVTTITAQATVARDGGVDPSVTARGTASVTVDFPVLSSIRLSRTSLTLGAYGAREQIVAEGLDQHGRPMSAVEFDWSVDSTNYYTSDGPPVVELILHEDPLGRLDRAEVVAYRNGTTSVEIRGTYVVEGTRMAGESAVAAASVEVAYPIGIAIGLPRINQAVQTSLGAVQTSLGDIPLINGSKWPLVRFPVYGYPAAVEDEANMPPWNHPLPPKMRVKVDDRHGTVIEKEIDISVGSRFLRQYQQGPPERIGGLETTANWRPSNGRFGRMWWTSEPVPRNPDLVLVSGEVIPPADWLVDATSVLAIARVVQVLPPRYLPITLVPVLQSRRPDLDHSIEWVREFDDAALYPTETWLGMTGMDSRNPGQVDRRTETYTTSADLTKKSGWDQLLREMLVKWTAEWGREGPLMYGALESPGGSGVVGMALTSARSGKGVVAIGYTGKIGPITRVNDAAFTMAHEIGHLMGLWHAPCDPSGRIEHVDPSFPYPGAAIGHAGEDIFGWGASYVPSGRGYRLVFALKSPTTHKDYMSYCGPEWVSDYHYLEALEHLHGPKVWRNAAALASPRSHRRAIVSHLRRDRQAMSSLAEYRPDRIGQMLLLWGATGPDHLLLEPSFVIRGPASVPEDGGPYRLEGLDAVGESLFSFNFTPSETEYGAASFAFLIPYQPSWEGRLGRIVLSGPEGEVALSHGIKPEAVLAADPASGRVRAILRDWDGRRSLGDAGHYSFSDGLPVVATGSREMR